MQSHLNRLITCTAVDRETLESEGLGLRPITCVKKVEDWQRDILARRFYRLAQWTETVQGPYWLTVRMLSRSLAERDVGS